MKSDYMNFDNNDKREKGQRMEDQKQIADSLTAFREADMELDRVYSLFPKACGLSDPEYWSLLLIYEGNVTQSAISEQLSMSRQTVNSAFKQLVKKGYIRLEPSKDDQRTKQAFLTDAGKGFVETYVVQIYQIEETAWGQMDPEERDTLNRLLRKYCRLVGEAMAGQKKQKETE